MRPYNGVSGFAGLPYAPHQPPVVTNIQPFYADRGGPDPETIGAAVGADPSIADSPLVNVVYAIAGIGLGGALGYYLARSIRKI